MDTLSVSAQELVGSFRSFGEFGPVYQVLRRNDEESLSIVVVESGETLNYPVWQALADPLAK